MICDPIWVEGFFLIFIFIFIFFILFNGFFELLHFAWKFHDVYQGMVTVEISWKTDRRESYFYHKVDSKTLNQGSHDSELLVRNSGINGAAIKWPRAPLLLRVNKLELFANNFQCGAGEYGEIFRFQLMTLCFWISGESRCLICG